MSHPLPLFVDFSKGDGYVLFGIYWGVLSSTEISSSYKSKNNMWELMEGGSYFFRADYVETLPNYS